MSEWWRGYVKVIRVGEGLCQSKAIRVGEGLCQSNQSGGGVMSK